MIKIFDSGWFVEFQSLWQPFEDDVAFVLFPTVVIESTLGSWSLSLAWLCFHGGVGRVYG